MSVSDSTDWLSTPLSKLAPLDAALRCQVCKDFFTTPMITSCAHTFCSLCIRRCLSQDGRCPVCREQDQEMKLRRNWVVEELVANFAESRDGLLDFAKDATEKAQKDDLETKRPKKRRKINDETTQLLERRSTRSQSRKDATQASQDSITNIAVEVVEDSEDGSECEYEEDRPSPLAATNTVLEDGLVACPVCGRRMKEQTVYAHLDTCTDASSDAAVPLPYSANVMQAGSIAYTLPNNTKQKDRLPTINYAMLSENQLRKKLRELGIPTVGPKILLQKRHTEWLNLWNANCDSREPQIKRALLSDLDTWERTQGRQIANNSGPSGVMVKDFDRDGYARSNRTDFDDLIRKAREKQGLAKLGKTGPGTTLDGDRTQLQDIFAPSVTNDEPETKVVHRSPNRTDESESLKVPSLESTQSQGSRTNDIVV